MTTWGSSLPTRGISPASSPTLASNKHREEAKELPALGACPVVSGQRAFSKAALAMNMSTPSRVGRAARLSSAYSALLKSITSSNTLVSPCGKSAMHGGLDSGRTIALLCAVLGCGAEALLLPLFTDLSLFVIT